MSYSRSIPRHPLAHWTISALVVALHAVLLWMVVWGRFLKIEPPATPPGIDVSLVFAPPGDAPSPPTPEPAPPEPEPAPPEPEPAPPEPAPPEPPPPEPPRPEPPRPVPVPEPPRPTPRPPEPKPAPKPTPKPPEPTWRPTTVEEIRRRNDFNQPAPTRPPPPPVDTRRLADSLRSAAHGVQVSPTTTSRNPTAANPAREQDYQAALAAAMRIHWSEDFNASELTGSGRTALARFVIRSDGSVASATIVRRSGVPAIDSRAERAVQAIRQFPAPSGYGITAPTYTVEFELKAKD